MRETPSKASSQAGGCVLRLEERLRGERGREIGGRRDYFESCS